MSTRSLDTFSVKLISTEIIPLVQQHNRKKLSATVLIRIIVLVIFESKNTQAKTQQDIRRLHLRLWEIITAVYTMFRHVIDKLLNW